MTSLVYNTIFMPFCSLQHCRRRIFIFSKLCACLLSNTLVVWRFLFYSAVAIEFSQFPIPTLKMEDKTDGEGIAVMLLVAGTCTKSLYIKNCCMSWMQLILRIAGHFVQSHSDRIKQNFESRDKAGKKIRFLQRIKSLCLCFHHQRAENQRTELSDGFAAVYGWENFKGTKTHASIFYSIFNFDLSLSVFSLFGLAIEVNQHLVERMTRKSETFVLHYRQEIIRYLFFCVKPFERIELFLIQMIVFLLLLKRERKVVTTTPSN